MGKVVFRKIVPHGSSGFSPCEVLFLVLDFVFVLFCFEEQSKWWQL